MDPRPRTTGGAWLACGAMAVALAALIVGIHRESPRTLLSAHGLLHAAVAQELVDDGLRVPPANPFFAGERLPYYWVFHALGAASARVLDVDPLHGFEALIVAATVALVFACAALARRLYGTPWLGSLLAFLVLAGGQAQALLVFAWKQWRWGAPMWAENPNYLWGLAHPMLGTIRLFDPYARHGPPLNFFFNVTSRPLALVGVVVLVLALHRCLGRAPALGRTLTLGGAAALTTALSLVIGLPTALALGGGVIAVAAAEHRRRTGVLGGLDLPAGGGTALAALLIGAALGLASGWHLLGRGSSAGLLAEGGAGVLRDLRSQLACAWLPGALAVWTAWRATGERRAFLWGLLAAAALLCAGALLIALPVGNQVDLFLAAAVLIAVVASGSVVRGDGRISRAGAAVLVAVFLPVSAFTVYAYTGRPAVPVGFESGHLIRTPPDSPAARLYAWIRSETPRDAVFVIDPDDPIRAVLGNTAELPAFTGRRLFTDRPGHYLVEPNADAARRAAVARALVRGRPLALEEATYLAGRGGELYILTGPALSTEHRAAARRRLGRPVFEAGAYAVYMWKPGASGEVDAP